MKPGNVPDNTEEDELLFEIPAFLTKCDSGELFVLQYPTLKMVNSEVVAIDGEIRSARLKKKCRLLELEQEVMSNPIYDESFGEQLAINADGVMRDKRDPKDNYFQSGIMDKMILRSECPLQNVDRYAVAHYTKDVGLCLSPVDCVMPLRPALNYIDMSNEREKKEKKSEEEDAGEGPANEGDRLVTTHFGRADVERRKNPNSATYDSLQKKKEAEPWIPIEYKGIESRYSEHQRQMTIQNISSENIDQFHLPSSHFLSLLVPQATNYTVAAGAVTASATAEELAADIPMTMLYTFPLERQLETIMRKVGVGSFGTIVECLESDVRKNEPLLIDKLQTSATLVQGCWVLKSTILFPMGESTDMTSQSSSTKKNPPPTLTTPFGTSYERMQDARDFALSLLAKDGFLERSKVNEKFPLPGEDMLTLLRGIARPASDKDNRQGKWLFRLPTDQEFITQHHEVARRYSMKWGLIHHKYDSSQR